MLCADELVRWVTYFIDGFQIALIITGVGSVIHLLLFKSRMEIWRAGIIITAIALVWVNFLFMLPSMFRTVGLSEIFLACPIWLYKCVLLLIPVVLWLICKRRTQFVEAFHTHLFDHIITVLFVLAIPLSMLVMKWTDEGWMAVSRVFIFHWITMNDHNLGC